MTETAELALLPVPGFKCDQNNMLNVHTSVMHIHPFFSQWHQLIYYSSNQLLAAVTKSFELHAC